VAQDGAVPSLAEGAQNLLDPLEIAVTNAGDIIGASGSAANPYLVLLHAGSGRVERLTDIAGAVRYPAISPDGERLAFSRRESGSWHLFIRDLAAGREHRFTRGACNAMSPHWETPQTLVYVSDCGRGLALGAAARVNVGN
jgi:Tol biopolymer transport system component